MTTNYNTASLSNLTTILAEVSEAYKAKTLSLVSDSDRKPTWDGRRFHAPCNNYDFDGRSYAAGEYLHDPDVNGTGTVKNKVLIDASLLDVIRETLSTYWIICSKGKTWVESDGSESCYLYLEGPGRYVNAITRFAPMSGQKALVLADEGFETGKTWETTIGRIKQRYFCDYNLSSLIPVSDGLSEKVYSWALKDKKDRKTEKVTVGFHYPKKTRIEKS